MALGDLPQEILYQVFTHIPPVEIPKLELVCNKFNGICGPLLWRECCRLQYQYWSTDHRIEEKFSQLAVEHNWKHIYAERHRIDRDVSRQIDSILASQLGRLDKTRRIIEHGYDAKDILLTHLNTEIDVEDVLARRYITST